MRVVQVIDSLEPGGAERSLLALAPHWIRRDVELHVVSLATGGSLAATFRDAGAVVTETGTAARVANVRGLVESFRAIRPDLVHTTLFEADVAGRVAARLQRVPVVSSLVNEAYGPEHRLAVRSTWKVAAAQALDLVTARRVRRFHAVSESVARVMTRRLLIPSGRVDVVPRARDDAVLGRRTPARRRAVRQRLGLGDVPVVLALARQEPQKRLDVLVRAMRTVRSSLPQARLVLAGRRGVDSPRLRELVSVLELSDSVIDLGPRDDVPELLAAADVLVLSSDREGMPGSLIEAMALETPIVASDIEAVRDVVGATAQQLVAVGDVAALAGAVIAALSAPDVRRVEAGRVRYEQRHRAEGVADRMVEFYERALAG